MSFLAPLYLVGILAVTLPILLHWVRRSPKGRRTFSSLMFLRPSPPRLARRSRLEHLLLLLLRAAALTLIALAFARPFLRDADRAAAGVACYRAILLDTSASMRRGDLWPRAQGEVEGVLADSDSADVVALYTFDRSLAVRFGLDEAATLEADARADRIRQILTGLSPTWHETRLGECLAAAADLLEARLDPEGAAPARRELVLVTDLQQGSGLEALEAYEWPPRVRVVVRPVAAPGSGNAWLRPAGAARSGSPAVRIVNAEDSAVSEFRVRWAAGEAAPEPVSEAEETHHVPPGESRVVALPERPAGADRLVLSGDRWDFDNELYVAGTRPQDLAVVYLGRDAADDPKGLLYYLSRVFPGDELRRIEVRAERPDEWAARLRLRREGRDDPVAKQRGLGAPAALVVVDAPLEQPVRAALREHLAADGVVLVVLRDAAAALAETLGDLLDAPGLTLREADVAGYSVVGDLDLRHPLLAPFADSRFTDFTGIHFWRHRILELPATATADVLLRLDDGAPLLVEQAVGGGWVVALASGWHPVDSELARASKFPPLLGGILGRSPRAAPLPTQYAVGEGLELAGTGAATLVRPDGTEQVLATAAEARRAALDAPGLYRLRRGADERELAVNLAARESDVQPADRAALEEFGVALSAAGPRTAGETRRTLRDVELESGQRHWQWLLAAALGLCVLETWWAGRLARRPARETSEAVA